MSATHAPVPDLLVCVVSRGPGIRRDLDDRILHILGDRHAYGVEATRAAPLDQSGAQPRRGRPAPAPTDPHDHLRRWLSAIGT